MGKKVCHSWCKTEENMLKEHMDLSIGELSELLGRSTYSVSKRLSSLGILRNKPYSDYEDSIILESYGNNTWSELSAKIGRSIGSVRRRARILGLSDESNIRNTQIQKRIHSWYEFNEDYFSIPALENCYWAGFIAADGCVSIVKRASGNDRLSLAISLHSRDAGHLEKFSSHIGFTGKIGVYKMKPSICLGKPIPAGEQCLIRINITEKVVKDLENNFNITPRKTLTLQAPNLTDPELILAFYIGLLDGDGSLSKTKGKRGLEYWYIQWSGTKHVLSFVKDYLDNKYPPTGRYSNRVANVNATPCNIFSYKIKGSRAVNIADAMLKLPTPKLDRKWVPYEEEVNLRK